MARCAGALLIMGDRIGGIGNQAACRDELLIIHVRKMLIDRSAINRSLSYHIWQRSHQAGDQFAHVGRLTLCRPLEGRQHIGVVFFRLWVRGAAAMAQPCAHHELEPIDFGIGQPGAGDA